MNMQKKQASAAFTFIYMLIVYIILVNKKYINGPIYILKPKLTDSKDLNS